MPSLVSLIVLNANGPQGAKPIPASSVITGVGFTVGAGGAEGVLTVATTSDVDSTAGPVVNGAVLAIHVFDANIATSIFYSDLKIPLKSDQAIYCQGIGGLSNAYALLRIETPTS